MPVCPTMNSWLNGPCVDFFVGSSRVMISTFAEFIIGSELLAKNQWLALKLLPVKTPQPKGQLEFRQAD